MRKRNSKRVLAVATVTALLSGVGVAAFAVDDAKEVRQADFIPTLADTRSAGHVDFLAEGLHVYTDDASSNAKAAQYFAPRAGVTGGFPDHASQDWYGTTPEPGKQIVFDIDGDRTNTNNFNIIVGEPVYGDDWWYTGGTTRAALRGFTCPQTSGGSGSDCHGTLAEWQAALPDAEVYALGFSLGSGIKGDGVLRSQTYGDDEYIFTDEAETAPAVEAEKHTAERAVTATGSWNNANRIARFTMTSAEQPADDTGRGAKVKWEIYVNGVRRYVSSNGWGVTSTWHWTFSTAGGNQLVEVKRNGSTFSTRQITTR